MLEAAGLPQPRMIFAHGWWVIDGEKLSKSRGPKIRPLDLAEIYGADAFRYFLMRNMTLGRDANFDEEGLRHRYQADLANDLGNLLHRLVNMLRRYCNASIPSPGPPSEAEGKLLECCQALPAQVFDLVGELAPNEALAQVMEVVKETNRYLEQTAPWQQAKQGQTERVETILYHAAEALRLASVLLQPVLPDRMSEVWRRLGWQPPSALRDGLTWGALQPGAPVVAGPPLFPKDIQ
jgi:methionyl-tRNA synthetase